MKDAGAILVINAGSSSVKYSLLADDRKLNVIAHGNEEVDDHHTHEDALKIILGKIDGRTLSGVVHRIVHGGTQFVKPVKITPRVVDALDDLSPLAPLHQPHNLAAVKIMAHISPRTPQVACFDTAFHAGHEPVFAHFGLPEEFYRRGVRRYGFHGLSYEWIAHVLKRDEHKLHKGRVIVAHLGNGASLCAMKGGKSIDTTMGMTALDGLPMGTRCGSLDPGALIYMIRDMGMGVERAEHVLYHDSGLKGLSGQTNDVRALLASRNPTARFALDYFALKTAQLMGMMAVALGGVDGIVFTGGIGENATPVRKAILKRLEFLKPFRTLVISANEERMMAMHAQRLLREKRH